MAAWPKSGRNALVYVSGTEIDGANVWNINIDSESVERRKFGDEWVDRVKSFKSWGGSITAIDNVKELTDAATATVSVSLLLYPDRDELGEYFSGNAIFGAGVSVDASGGADASSDFEGDGELTVVGFS